MRFTLAAGALLLCSGLALAVSIPPPPPLPPCGKPCVPKKAYLASDGCNYCSCPSDGNSCNAACTLIACLPPTKPPTCKPARPKKCEQPGEYLSDDGTEICTCYSDGTVTCFPNFPEERCKEGDVVKVGCNTCGCNADGTLGPCTQLECKFPDLRS